jgi:alcohol dehydrogenase
LPGSGRAHRKADGRTRAGAGGRSGDALGQRGAAADRPGRGAFGLRKSRNTFAWPLSDAFTSAGREIRGERKEELTKALVYHGPGQRAWEEVPDSAIEQPTDVIVRISSSTICGTDLHILKGDVPEVKPGTILGHEAVGTVVETGSGVATLKAGDRVLVSCITACGRCRFCKEGRYGLCTGGGGWIFGHLIDGLQAEYARVPFADTSVYKVPDELSDEQVLFLADILPTAYEVGVLNGSVQPGDTVAIVGAGPIGLAAILTAKLHTPGRIVAIDLADARLEKARDFGADVTINNGSEDAVERLMQLTGGLGADVAIEAVGVPETFELCADLVRAGGRVANVGVHGHPATLHLETLWIRDVTITTGLVDTFTTPQLLKLIAEGWLDATPFATHRFPLGETMSAYDTFAAAAETHALKVVLEAEPAAHAAVPEEEALAVAGS